MCFITNDSSSDKYLFYNGAMLVLMQHESTRNGMMSLRQVDKLFKERPDLPEIGLRDTDECKIEVTSPFESETLQEFTDNLYSPLRVERFLSGEQFPTRLYCSDENKGEEIRLHLTPTKTTVDSLEMEWYIGDQSLACLNTLKELETKLYRLSIYTIRISRQ